MKYMHFNSSCPYAGLANQLKLLGYDTEDTEIALKMNLPYLIDYDANNKCYLAGAMLQSKKWFDLYLNPLGYQYIEKTYSKETLLTHLEQGMMFGISINEFQKHAVIFLEINRKSEYVFINNKWENSLENEYLHFEKHELLDRLPDKIIVGRINKCPRKKISFIPFFQDSIKIWRKLQKDINEFVYTEHTSNELINSMNQLFRPLLVDSLAMMKLLNNQEISNKIINTQSSYLNSIKKKQTLTLNNEFDCSQFDLVIDEIIALIYDKIGNQ